MNKRIKVEAPKVPPLPVAKLEVLLALLQKTEAVQCDKCSNTHQCVTGLLSAAQIKELLNGR